MISRHRFEGPHYPSERISYFDHRPVVTLLRDGKDVVVTRPVDDVRPVDSQATAIGWAKYMSDAPEAIRVSKAEAAAFNRILKEFFEGRKADKEAAYAAKCDRAHRAGRPIPERPVFKDPPAGFLMYVKDPVLVRMYEEARSNRKVRKRLESFEHKKGRLSGRHVADFNEKFEGCNAIRTALNILPLQLFNSALPKFINMVFGYDKTTVFNASTSCETPLTIRDKPYLEIDRNRRCLQVVDLDGWWPSVKALRADMRKYLPEHMQPNIIVYRGDETRGGVSNPHLLFILPPGSRVIHEGKGKGKRKQQQFRLHAMVQKAIVSHLIPLGADPDHHNSFKMKNPLSPAWSIACFDGYFATLDDWRQTLPTIACDHREMKRRSKIHRADAAGGNEDVTLSNAIWNDGIVARRIAIRSSQKTNDPEFLASRRSHPAFCAWLEPKVTARLIAGHGDNLIVRGVIRAQMEWVRDLGQIPDGTGSWSDRGRDRLRNQMDMPALSWNATAEERKADELTKKSVAGRQSRTRDMKVNLGLIAEEIESRLAIGADIVKADVVKALVKAGTVSRSVAYARFDHVLEIVLQAARYQAQVLSGKQIDPSTSLDQHSVTVSEVVVTGPISPSAEDQPARTPSVDRHPAKTTIRPVPQRPAVNDQDGQRAKRIRESWRQAVATWRAARRPLTTDPVAVSAMLDSSAWSYRRH